MNQQTYYMNKFEFFSLKTIRSTTYHKYFIYVDWFQILRMLKAGETILKMKLFFKSLLHIHIHIDLKQCLHNIHL